MAGLCVVGRGINGCFRGPDGATTGEMNAGRGLINESDGDNSSNCICNRSISELVSNERYGGDSLPGRNFVPGSSGTRFAG